MITLLDTLGPAIWRASWQAAALALLVVLLLLLPRGTPVAAVAGFYSGASSWLGCCSWRLQPVPGACSIWSAGIRRRTHRRLPGARPMPRSSRCRMRSDSPTGPVRNERGHCRELPALRQALPSLG